MVMALEFRQRGNGTHKRGVVMTVSGVDGFVAVAGEFLPNILRDVAISQK